MSGPNEGSYAGQFRGALGRPGNLAGHGISSAIPDDEEYAFTAPTPAARLLERFGLAPSAISAGLGPQSHNATPLAAARTPVVPSPGKETPWTPNGPNSTHVPYLRPKLHPIFADLLDPSPAKPVRPAAAGAAAAWRPGGGGGGAGNAGPQRSGSAAGGYASRAGSAAAARARATSRQTVGAAAVAEASGGAVAAAGGVGGAPGAGAARGAANHTTGSPFVDPAPRVPARALAASSLQSQSRGSSSVSTPTRTAGPGPGTPTSGAAALAAAKKLSYAEWAQTQVRSPQGTGSQARGAGPRAASPLSVPPAERRGAGGSALRPAHPAHHTAPTSAAATGSAGFRPGKAPSAQADTGVGAGNGTLTDSPAAVPGAGWQGAGAYGDADFAAELPATGAASAFATPAAGFWHQLAAASPSGGGQAPPGEPGSSRRASGRAGSAELNTFGSAVDDWLRAPGHPQGRRSSGAAAAAAAAAGAGAAADAGAGELVGLDDGGAGAANLHAGVRAPPPRSVSPQLPPSRLGSSGYSSPVPLHHAAESDAEAPPHLHGSLGLHDSRHTTSLAFRPPADPRGAHIHLRELAEAAGGAVSPGRSPSRDPAPGRYQHHDGGLHAAARTQDTGASDPAQPPVQPSARSPGRATNCRLDSETGSIINDSPLYSDPDGGRLPALQDDDVRQASMPGHVGHASASGSGWQGGAAPGPDAAPAPPNQKLLTFLRGGASPGSPAATGGPAWTLTPQPPPQGPQPEPRLGDRDTAPPATANGGGGAVRSGAAQAAGGSPGRHGREQEPERRRGAAGAAAAGLSNGAPAEAGPAVGSHTQAQQYTPRHGAQQSPPRAGDAPGALAAAASPPQRRPTDAAPAWGRVHSHGLGLASEWVVEEGNEEGEEGEGAEEREGVPLGDWRSGLRSSAQGWHASGTGAPAAQDRGAGLGAAAQQQEPWGASSRGQGQVPHGGGGGGGAESRAAPPRPPLPSSRFRSPAGSGNGDGAGMPGAGASQAPPRPWSSPPRQPLLGPGGRNVRHAPPRQSVSTSALAAAVRSTVAPYELSVTGAPAPFHGSTHEPVGNVPSQRRFSSNGSVPAAARASAAALRRSLARHASRTALGGSLLSSVLLGAGAAAAGGDGGPALRGSIGGASNFSALSGPQAGVLYHYPSHGYVERAAEFRRWEAAVLRDLDLYDSLQLLGHTAAEEYVDPTYSAPAPPAPTHAPAHAPAPASPAGALSAPTAPGANAGPVGGRGVSTVSVPRHTAGPPDSAATRLELTVAGEEARPRGSTGAGARGAGASGTGNSPSTSSAGRAGRSREGGGGTDGSSGAATPAPPQAAAPGQPQRAVSVGRVPRGAVSPVRSAAGTGLPAAANSSEALLAAMMSDSRRPTGESMLELLDQLLHENPLSGSRFASRAGTGDGASSTISEGLAAAAAVAAAIADNPGGAVSSGGHMRRLSSAVAAAGTSPDPAGRLARERATPQRGPEDGLASPPRPALDPAAHSGPEPFGQAPAGPPQSGPTTSLSPPSGAMRVPNQAQLTPTAPSADSAPSSGNGPPAGAHGQPQGAVAAAPLHPTAPLHAAYPRQGAGPWLRPPAWSHPAPFDGRRSYGAPGSWPQRPQPHAPPTIPEELLAHPLPPAALLSPSSSVAGSGPATEPPSRQSQHLPPPSPPPQQEAQERRHWMGQRQQPGYSAPLSTNDVDFAGGGLASAALRYPAPQPPWAAGWLAPAPVAAVVGPPYTHPGHVSATVAWWEAGRRGGGPAAHAVHLGPGNHSWSGADSSAGSGVAHATLQQPAGAGAGSGGSASASASAVASAGSSGAVTFAAALPRGPSPAVAAPRPPPPSPPPPLLYYASPPGWLPPTPLPTPEVAYAPPWGNVATPAPSSASTPLQHTAWHEEAGGHDPFGFCPGYGWHAPPWHLRHADPQQRQQQPPQGPQQQHPEQQQPLPLGRHPPRAPPRAFPPPRLEAIQQLLEADLPAPAIAAAVAVLAGCLPQAWPQPAPHGPAAGQQRPSDRAEEGDAEGGPVAAGLSPAGAAAPAAPAAGAGAGAAGWGQEAGSVAGARGPRPAMADAAAPPRGHSVPDASTAAAVGQQSPDAGIPALGSKGSGPHPSAPAVLYAANPPAPTLSASVDHASSAGERGRRRAAARAATSRSVLQSHAALVALAGERGMPPKPLQEEAAGSEAEPLQSVVAACHERGEEAERQLMERWLRVAGTGRATGRRTAGGGGTGASEADTDGDGRRALETAMPGPVPAEGPLARAVRLIAQSMLIVLAGAAGATAAAGSLGAVLVRPEDLPCEGCTSIMYGRRHLGRKWAARHLPR